MILPTTAVLLLALLPKAIAVPRPWQIDGGGSESDFKTPLSPPSMTLGGLFPSRTPYHPPFWRPTKPFDKKKSERYAGSDENNHKEDLDLVPSFPITPACHSKGWCSGPKDKSLCRGYSCTPTDEIDPKSKKHHPWKITKNPKRLGRDASSATDLALSYDPKGPEPGIDADHTEVARGDPNSTQPPFYGGGKCLKVGDSCKGSLDKAVCPGHECVEFRRGWAHVYLKYSTTHSSRSDGADLPTVLTDHNAAGLNTTTPTVGVDMGMCQLQCVHSQTTAQVLGDMSIHDLGDKKDLHARCQLSCCSHPSDRNQLPCRRCGEFPQPIDYMSENINSKLDSRSECSNSIRDNRDVGTHNECHQSCQCGKRVA